MTENEITLPEYLQEFEDTHRVRRLLAIEEEIISYRLAIERLESEKSMLIPKVNDIRARRGLKPDDKLPEGPKRPF